MNNIDFLEDVIEGVESCNSLEEALDFLYELKEELEINQEYSDTNNFGEKE